MIETGVRTRGYLADEEALVKRLRRIAGQVRGLERMIEDGRYHVDLITQIAAVIAALESLAARILDEHVQRCVADALAAGDAAEGERKRRELLDAVRRLARTP